MPTGSTPRRPSFGVLQAPAHWQAVDLISDLHLQPEQPQVFEAWRKHMQATDADAVLILGDLFEVWVGDDAVAQDPFLQACAQVLQQTSGRLPVYFMPGNRDFLLGADFAQACGLHTLSDPTVLAWAEQRVVLSHGDALCLDDKAYQQFRALCRTPQWQEAFLSRPLSERLLAARQMRSQSQAHQSQPGYQTDADTDLCIEWLQAADSQHLIHGHTHHPADHLLETTPPARRQVLSDWHAAPSPRAEVLRLTRDGTSRRLPLPL